jgi:hypothetical protein
MVLTTDGDLFKWFKSSEPAKTGAALPLKGIQGLPSLLDVK